MRRPYVALLIAGEQGRRMCDKEQKTISIRQGHRDYQVDDILVLCCHLAGWAGPLAKVTDVRHTIIEKVLAVEYMQDGFDNTSDMIAGLRQFYPGLDEETSVTIIRWEYLT